LAAVVAIATAGPDLRNTTMLQKSKKRRSDHISLGWLAPIPFLLTSFAAAPRSRLTLGQIDKQVRGVLISPFGQALAQI